MEEEEEVLIENEMCFKLNIVVVDFFFLVVEEFKEIEFVIKLVKEEDRGEEYNQIVNNGELIAE